MGRGVVYSEKWYAPSEDVAEGGIRGGNLAALRVRGGYRTYPPDALWLAERLFAGGYLQKKLKNLFFWSIIQISFWWKRSALKTPFNGRMSKYPFNNMKTVLIVTHLCSCIWRSVDCVELLNDVLHCFVLRLTDG